jgi:hypothetical protein
MCCNRDNYNGSKLLLLFIILIIIGSISILTHSTIGYIIGILLILIAFSLFIKIILMNRINNDNNDDNDNDNKIDIIKYTTEPKLLKTDKYKLCCNNQEKLKQYKIKCLIEFIYDNNDYDYDIINENIDNIIDNYYDEKDRKDLLIKIHRELIQMKVKELNDIMINNLKDINNISEETIQNNLNTNKRNLYAYKDDLKILFNSLNDVKIDIND